MKFLRLSLLALALGCFAGAAEADAPLIADASFADLYRLATAPGLPQLAAAPAQGIPVSFPAAPARTQQAAKQAVQQAGFAVSAGPVPQPGRWPLMLAGLAAVVWVARRRLSYSL